MISHLYCTPHHDLASRGHKAIFLGAIKVTRVFIGNHCIGTWRQRGACHNANGRSRHHSLAGDRTGCNAVNHAQPDGGLGGSLRHIRRPHSIAIHRRVVKGRYGDIGDNLLRQDPALRFQDGCALRLQRLNMAQDLCQCIFYTDQLNRSEKSPMLRTSRTRCAGSLQSTLPIQS